MSRESPPRRPPEGTSIQDCFWDLPPQSHRLETTPTPLGGRGPRYAHTTESHAAIFFYERTNYRNYTRSTNVKNTALKERKEFQKHVPRNSISMSSQTAGSNRGRADGTVCASRVRPAASNGARGLGCPCGTSGGAHQAARSDPRIVL